MVVFLTVLGVIFACLLWIFFGPWEWSIPKNLETKICTWKKRWYHSQAIVRFINRDTVTEQEQFGYSLRNILSKMEREFAAPVHVEVEITKPDIALTEEEMRYISCMSRSFSEFTWSVRERATVELE